MSASRSCRWATPKALLEVVFTVLLRCWPPAVRRSHGAEVVEMAVAAVERAHGRPRCTRAMKEAAALVVGGTQMRVARACGGTVAGGWVVSLRWAVAALLCWASLDAALLLARNAPRWWSGPNLVAVTLCLVTAVAVRVAAGGATLLPFHVAMYLLVVDAVRTAVWSSIANWPLLLVSAQGAAAVLLAVLVIGGRQPMPRAPRLRVPGWSSVLPAALLVSVVQLGRGMPLSTTPEPFVIAVVLGMAVLCVVEPRAAVAAAALLSVALGQTLLVGVDASAWLAAALAGVLVLGVSADWNIRTACRS